VLKIFISGRLQKEISNLPQASSIGSQHGKTVSPVSSAPPMIFYYSALPTRKKMVGFLAYYPLLLTHLKEHIGDFSSPEIINIDHSDIGMLAFLKSIGSEFVVNQFEMKLDL